MDWLGWTLTLLLGFTVAAPEPSESGGTSVSTEMRLARALVEDQVGPEGDIESASYVLRRGAVARPNTGEPCTSGHLIKVKIIGTFPHSVTTGGPWTSLDDADGDVHAVLITAEATTGRACQIGVQTGDPNPLPGAIDIPLE